MGGGGVVVKTTISSSIKSLLPSKVSYAHNIFCINNELKGFQSCLKWMHVNQSDTRHAVVF